MKWKVLNLETAWKEVDKENLRSMHLNMEDTVVNEKD